MAKLKDTVSAKARYDGIAPKNEERFEALETKSSCAPVTWPRPCPPIIKLAPCGPPCSRWSVSVSSGANYVAVVNHSCCTPSVPNIIGGTTSSGTLNYGSPIFITFFDPAASSSAGVTDSVQMRGEFTSIAGTESRLS